MRSLCFVLLIVWFSCQKEASAKVSCKDESGNDVDWYVYIYNLELIKRNINSSIMTF